MKKKTFITKRTMLAKSKSGDVTLLIAEVRDLIQSARHAAASVVNTLQVRTNFEIGHRIVEHEQKGAKRAAYGAELLKELSARLTEEFGKGFSERNLEYMREFFLTLQDRIQQPPSVKLPLEHISQYPVAKSRQDFTSRNEAAAPAKDRESASRRFGQV